MPDIDIPTINVPNINNTTNSTSNTVNNSTGTSTKADTYTIKEAGIIFEAKDDFKTLIVSNEKVTDETLYVYVNGTVVN